MLKPKFQNKGAKNKMLKTKMTKFKMPKTKVVKMKVIKPNGYSNCRNSYVQKNSKNLKRQK